MRILAGLISLLVLGWEYCSPAAASDHEETTKQLRSAASSVREARESIIGDQWPAPMMVSSVLEPHAIVIVGGEEGVSRGSAAPVVAVEIVSGAGEGTSDLVVARQQHALRIPAIALTETPQNSERLAAAVEYGARRAPDGKFADAVKALTPFLAKLRSLASRLARKEPDFAKRRVPAPERQWSRNSGRPPAFRQIDQHPNLEAADSRAPQVGFAYHYNDEASRIVYETNEYATGTVRLSETSTETVTVDYATHSGLDTRFNPRGYQAAQAGSDYLATSGTLTFMPGETEKEISVPVIFTPDPDTEPFWEGFTIRLSNPVNATLGPNKDRPVWIANYGIPHAIWIENTSEKESAGVFPVSIQTIELHRGFTLDYITADFSNDADEHEDYEPVSGRLRFRPGQTSYQIDVPLVNDCRNEPDETFQFYIYDSRRGQEQFIWPNFAWGRLTIEDDDAANQLLIESTQISVAEDGGPAVIPVRLCASQNRQVTVDYETADGTALAGSDYTARSRTLTFPAGQQIRRIRVPIIDDDIDEPDEEFTVRLTGATNAALPDSSEASVTILDNDEAVTVGVLGTDVPESIGVARVRIQLGAQTSSEVSVQFATSDGSATAHADYTPVSTNLAFAPGEEEKTVDIPILEDDLIEGAESFTVRLSAPTNAEIGDGTATVTIRDNDARSELAIVDPDVVTEGYGTVSVEVTLSPARSTEVAVDWSTEDGTAVAGADYETGAGTIVFAPGETSKSLELAVIDDEAVEDEEVFHVRLANPVGDAEIVRSRATVTIIDDDRQPTLRPVDVTASENAGTARMRVLLSPAATEDVSVQYATGDGTAVSGMDYVMKSEMLTIPAGSTEEIIEIGLIDDGVVERAETFSVALHSPENAELSRNEATVTILDDDAPAVSIDDVTVQEYASEAVFSVSLTAAHVDPVTVRYASEDGTATAWEDYVPVAGELTFPAGETSRVIRVQIFDDTSAEDDETFTVVLTSAANVALGDASGEGTIVDDDTYELTISDAAVQESAGSARFAVTLNRANAEQQITVRYAMSDGTATAGLDYTSESDVLTIAAGTLGANIDVVILDDDESEDSETFTVTLSDATNAEIIDGTGQGTILDDDVPGLSVNGTSVREDAGAAVFVVHLDRASSETVAVGFDARPITATEGEDYVAAGGSIVFEPGETAKRIDVVVLDDSMDEPDETFEIVLIDAQHAVIRNAEAMATILDDDAPPVLAVQEGYTVLEGAGSVAIAATLSAASAFEISASYATSDGTASAGADYVADSGTLTFAPGETDHVISVSILDDNLDEPDETFVLRLVSPANATLGSGESVVTILDDDTVPVISIDDVSAGESEAGAVFTVRLSSPTSLEVGLRYATEDETATAEEDYKTTSGTLSFEAGELAKQIRVPLIDDDVDEENETFLVRLSALENAEIGDVVGRGTITDDDEPLTISIYDGRADEDAGMLRLPVRLSRRSTRAVSVLFATSDVEAEAGLDYTSSRGIVIFEPNSTEGVVAIVIEDDVLDEEDETFQVRLSRPTNAAIARGLATGTITDNDGSPLLRIGDITVGESGGAAIFTISLSAPSAHVVTALYRTVNGTAEAGTDYVEAAGTLVFKPGELKKEIRVPILQDGRDWRHETFMLVLESATHARLEDAVAEATIVEEEPVEEGVLQVHLARFARTSASHVVEALGERFRWQETSTSCLSAAGQSIANLRHINPAWDPSVGELLSGCRLAARSGALSVWGRGAFTRLSGKDGALSLSADVTTATLGADYAWSSGLTAGIVMARSHGAGTFEAYAQEGETGSAQVGAYPYVSYEMGANSVWALAGYGRGSAEVAGADLLETSLGSRLVAAGVVGTLANGRIGRLTYEVDAFTAHANAEEVTDAAATRIRGALQGSAMLPGGVHPYVETGLRHDGGDALAGLGLEVGGGVRLARPESRLRAEVSARSLVVHASEDFSEWGLAAAFRYGDPAGLGPTLSVRPSWGAAQRGGLNALWQRYAVADLAMSLPGRRSVELVLGYGTPLVVAGGVARPVLAVALRERGRDYRLGYEVRTKSGLSLSASGTARESALPYNPVLYGISVRSTLAW